MLWLATTQRADLALELVNDGLHAYGPGIWLFHDHQYKGHHQRRDRARRNISAIVYSQYLDEAGWPQTRGVPWDRYFTRGLLPQRKYRCGSVTRRACFRTRDLTG